MNKDYKRTFISTIGIVFILLIGMIGYTFLSFYKRSEDEIEALGESNLYNESAQIEKCVQKGQNALAVTAYSVGFMIDNGASIEEIHSYLEEESEHQKNTIDENFTGIYGYIKGEYVDGVNWEPPADYEPKKRIWYTEAYDAKGKITFVPPYVDAQTNTVMISVCKLLDDGESVVSLDIALNEIQSLTEDIKMEDAGYGFIVDKRGLIIAHSDVSQKGANYSEGENSELLNQILEVKSGKFQTKINGERCTVFTDEIFDDWHVVMVVSNTKLYMNIRHRIIIDGAVCLAVFATIIGFLIKAYRKIRMYEMQDEESKSKLRALNANMMKALAFTIDSKDRYTSGHSQRVAIYSVELAKRMGKSEEEQKTIYYAGLLHDIGKIRVPEVVINKPGKLTDEEFDQIKIHPVSGYHTLKDIYDDKQVALGAKYHHERFDGSGYPNGLVGENIPEIARIIGVADAYDAMASNRSYRDALPQDVVRSEIIKGKGKQFDPAIADIMIEMIDSDSNYEMRQMDEVFKDILVIDDEPMNIELVKFILKEEPVNIYSVDSGEEGLKFLKEKSVDLVLLDIAMPDMNGFEVYKKLREISDAHVVFMTSDKNLDSLTKSTEIGIDDYITKPFLPLVLIETVYGIVNQWE